jgi:hypothetical protein
MFKLDSPIEMLSHYIEKQDWKSLQSLPPFRRRYSISICTQAGSRSTYKTQKFIGVVSTLTEIWFFEKGVQKVVKKLQKIWKFDFKKKYFYLIFNLHFKFKFKFDFFWFFWFWNWIFETFFLKSYLSLSTDNTYKFLVHVWIFP